MKLRFTGVLEAEKPEYTLRKLGAVDFYSTNWESIEITSDLYAFKSARSPFCTLILLLRNYD